MEIKALYMESSVNSYWSPEQIQTYSASTSLWLLYVSLAYSLGKI